MLAIPNDLRQKLRDHGQEHVLAGWERLGDTERKGLLDQLRPLDLEQLRQLYEGREHTFTLPSAEQIAPVPVIRMGTGDQAARERGEACLCGGEVAVLLVAGGQGSRLGFEHPKGMFAIGPVTDKSLFQ